MILCPVAVVVGCKKCPALAVCPVKGVIGDYKKPEEAQTQTDKAHSGGKPEG